MQTMNRSVLTCPTCNGRTEQEMPVDACVVSFECPSCKILLYPQPRSCCVFCSYGSVKCPPVQLKTNCRAL
jgi:hypothetical protein